MGHSHREGKDKDKEGAVAPMDTEPASPRPPLSPSNFNALSSPPSPQTSAKKGGKARKSLGKEGSNSGPPSGSSESSESRRSAKKPFAGGTLSPSHNPGGGSASTRRSPRDRMNGGLSPSHVAEATASTPASRRSPRDRMNIDHLLSNTARSPWSPGFSSWMPKFTNNFADGSGVKKPTTNKKFAGPDNSSSEMPSMPAHSAPTEGRSGSLAIRRDLEGAFENTGSQAPPPQAEADDKGTLGHLPVQLFVAAVGDGQIASDVPQKARDLLEQVVKKVSKEQNTVVNVKGEGPLHIQLRVFAYRSVEAQALKDYIMSHSEQVPCPFILLAKALPMAVAYDTSSIDPSNANVADRLRKQAKTRAIKLLREVILDSESGVTAAMLRGRHGPLEPEKRLKKLIMSRATHLQGVSMGQPESKYIAFPAVRRQGELPSGGDDGGKGGAGQRGQREEVKRPFPTQKKSGSHFPVSLTVIALGDGLIARNTQPKLLHRLRQLVDKVPKEHRCSIELPREGSVSLNMRLFVANSEDAKAAREYVFANATQRPTPFVILSHALPIAVSYDARLLDVSDANVVDCLRKQAKTRAVKLIKETIADPAVGVTLGHLRGHEGSMSLAELLEGPLMQHAISFGGDKKYIAFAARKRQISESAFGKDKEDAFAGLDSLASAAVHSSGGRNGRIGESEEEEVEGDDPGHPMMSQQRVCEMCKATNDGSYGTGRFCSKACRYEAHALRVAQQRRIQSVGPAAGGVGGGEVEVRSGHDKPEAAGGKGEGRRSKAAVQEEEQVDEEEEEVEEKTRKGDKGKASLVKQEDRDEDGRRRKRTVIATVKDETEDEEEDEETSVAKKRKR